MRVNLRAERARKGLTTKKAAEMVGVTQNTYYRWEHGLCVPSAMHVINLSKLYGISAEEILEDVKQL